MSFNLSLASSLQRNLMKSSSSFTRNLVQSSIRQLSISSLGPKPSFDSFRQNLTPEEKELLKQRTAASSKPRPPQSSEPTSDPVYESNALTYSRAVDEGERAYMQAFQATMTIRDQIHKETGFKYPDDRFIPKENRPTDIEETNSSMFHAAMTEEDYELAWYRYSRILKFTPPTCVSLLLPPLGSEMLTGFSPNDNPRRPVEFYSFEPDRNTLQIALFTCTSALSNLERLHNPDVIEKAQYILTNLEESWFKPDSIPLEEPVLIPHTLESLSSSGERKMLTDEPSNVATNKNRRIRKLVTDVQSDVQSDENTLANTNTSSEEDVDIMSPSTPQSVKIVINDQFGERAIGGEEAVQFISELGELAQGSLETKRNVIALVKEARSPFSELGYVTTQTAVWQQRLAFVCRDIIDHYYALIHSSNPGLYTNITANRTVPKESVSASKPYRPSIGNDLALLKAATDAALAADLSVIALEAMSLTQHLSIYLDPLPSVKKRRERLYNRMKKKWEEDIENGVVDSTEPFKPDQDALDQLGVSMVKAPIMYTGLYKSDGQYNDMKNIKFFETSPLTSLMKVEDLTNMVKHMAHTARQTHLYHTNRGVDERLILLSPELQQHSMLGVGCGVRRPPTSVSLARQCLTLIDGFIVDYARQFEADLPKDYLHVLKDTTEINIPKTFIRKDVPNSPPTSESVKAEAEAIAKATDSQSTEIDENKFVKGSYLGVLQSKPMMRREEYWRKVKSMELTDEKLHKFSIEERIQLVDSRHIAMRKSNILAAIFNQNPELLPLYLDMARHANDKVSLAKALIILRNTTRLTEWVQAKSSHDLYVDVETMYDSVQTPDDAEKIMMDIESQRTAKGPSNFSVVDSTMLSEAELKKMGKAKRRQYLESISASMKREADLEKAKAKTSPKTTRDFEPGERYDLGAIDVKDINDLPSNEDINVDVDSIASEELFDDNDLDPMFEEFIQTNYPGQERTALDKHQDAFFGNNKTAQESYPMYKRLKDIETASDVYMSSELCLSALDLYQHLSINEINLLNTGLPASCNVKCYSDEATSLWGVMRARLNRERGQQGENGVVSAIDISLLNRPDHMLTPLELDAAKVVLMTIETLLIEQCIPSARVLANVAYSEGLIQEELIEAILGEADAVIKEAEEKRKNMKVPAPEDGGEIYAETEQDMQNMIHNQM